MNFSISRNSRRIAMLGAMFSVAASAMLPVSLQAEDVDGTWQWRGSIYVFLPTISGTSKYPVEEGGSSIEVGADTLLDTLDFTFMAALDVHNGEWGAFTDLIYLNLGGSKTGIRDFSLGEVGIPASVNMDAKLDIKSLIWTVAGTYMLSMTEENTTQLLLGARMLDYEQTLNWTFNGDIGSLPLPGRSGVSVVGPTNWDAIVGLKGHTSLGTNGKWFIPYHLDVGTGDSNLTWQAMAGVGYAFGWGSAVLTWRHLDYEFESGSLLQETSFSGPMFGASFQW